MEDGLFQEEMIEPRRIVENDEDDMTTLIGKDGRKFTISKKGARSSLYLYLNRQGTKRPDIWAMDPKKREVLMNQNLMEYEVEGKSKFFKLILDDEGAIDAVVTEKHKQISYSKVRETVENAVKQVIPDANFYDRGMDRYWTYSLPVSSKYVQSYVGVDAGVNKPRGRCAIYVYARFEVNYTGQDGTRTPCHKEQGLSLPVTIIFDGDWLWDTKTLKKLMLNLSHTIRPNSWNWAYWQRAPNFFGIPLDTFPWPKKYEKLKELSSKAVHVQGTEVKEEDISNAIRTIVENAEIIDPIIEDSMKVPLDTHEIKAIIEAYQETVGLPQYIAEMISENVLDMDLWGLSNAVSYVRTHGELKTSKIENREARPLVSRLENIAGELLTLGPVILELKRKIPNGKLTKDILLNPEGAMYSFKAAKILEEAEGTQRQIPERIVKTGREIFEEEE